MRDVGFEEFGWVLPGEDEPGGFPIGMAVPYGGFIYKAHGRCIIYARQPADLFEEALRNYGREGHGRSTEDAELKAAFGSLLVSHFPDPFVTLSLFLGSF